jgi:hypothetical protein
MAAFRKILLMLDAAAAAWLPDDYAFGIELAHDGLTESDPEDLTLVDAGSAEVLARWRTRLARPSAPNATGASADLAALPMTGRFLLVEIQHKPTGIRAVRTYAYETIRDLATNDALTVAQKRAQVRTALGNLYQTVQDRVVAAGG